MTKFSLQFRIFLTLILNVISSNFSLCSRSFEFDPTWPNASIASLPYHGTGAVPDPENNLLVLTRGTGFFAGRNETVRVNVVLVVDRINGTVLREWGADIFYHPHGIESARNGDIFVTDIVLHQVFRFQYIPIFRVWNNKPIITLGQRFISGNDQSHFCEPADVAVEPDTDDFYVADGYCNTRVVKFDRYGNYLFEITAASSDPNIPTVPFNIVHKVVVAVRHSPTDLNKKDVIVVVTDRVNIRIQYFNGNGSFLYEQNQDVLGVSNTVLMSVAHANVNPMDEPYNIDFQGDFGIIYAADNGFGATPGTILEIAVGESNAFVMSRFPSNQSDPFVRRGPLHDLTCSRDGSEIYVVTSNSGTLLVKRFQLEVSPVSGSSRLLPFLFIIMAMGVGILLQ